MIVNADSQQLFADLPILTARPTAADEARCRTGCTACSQRTSSPRSAAGWHWSSRCLAAARAEGRPAIVVGGTGLYLHALLHGIPAMPAHPAALRAEPAGVGGDGAVRGNSCPACGARSWHGGPAAAG